MDARSSKPRDVPVFARHSSNARIAGTHETIARRNANELESDELSTGGARRNHPPNARPDRGGDVPASRTPKIEHLAGDRPADHVRALVSPVAAGALVHVGSLNGAPRFTPDSSMRSNERSGCDFAAACAIRSKNHCVPVYRTVRTGSVGPDRGARYANSQEQTAARPWPSAFDL